MQNNKFRLYDSIKVILLVNFLETVGWSCYAPTLPHLHSNLGFTEVHVGAIVSATSTVGLISALLVGKFSDKYGRVGVIKCSALIQGFGSFILALFALDVLSDPRLFVATRAVCSGMKAGIFICQAYIADVARLSGNAGAAVNEIARLMSAGSLGLIAGSALGGQLQNGGAYFLSICAFCAEIILLYSVKEPSEVIVQSQATYAAQKSDGALRTIIGSRSNDLNDTNVIASEGGSNYNLPQVSTSFLLQLRVSFQIGNTIYESLQSMHLRIAMQASTNELGWLLAAMGVISTLSNGWLVPSLNLTSDNYVSYLMVALLGQALALCVWAVTDQFFIATCSSIILAITSNVFLSIVSGLLGAASQAPEKDHEERTSTGSTYGLSIAYDRGCRALAPAIGGICFENGYGPLAVTLPPLVAASNLWLHSIVRNRDREANHDDSNVKISI